MTEPKKLKPQVVSAFLGHEFTRSTESRSRKAGWSAVYPGFKVREGLGPLGRAPYVTVEYVIGTKDSTLRLKEQERLIQEHLTAYRQLLERRYRVTLNDRADLLIIETKDG